MSIKFLRQLTIRANVRFRVAGTLEPPSFRGDTAGGRATAPGTGAWRVRSLGRTCDDQLRQSAGGERRFAVLSLALLVLPREQGHRDAPSHDEH